ncbi:MAG: L-seryl-tRNA(Sec) selenium transferase [Planctomycetes bacterium]|nr:L-seryl-tRNA(Sec) selenium transferase [Planctomycetota bacterium]
MNELLDEAVARGIEAGREAQRAAVSAELNQVRADCRAGKARELDDGFWQAVAHRIKVLPTMRLREALNATGVVLHTNLGRAPWAPEAIEAAQAASQAAVLEVSPESGRRGRRERAVSDLLAEVTGAESGLAVNNNAAALTLAVASLARGRGCVLARTEMVEIGGSYRMPEVVRSAGARLIEIGTTNRVHLKDYAEALDDPDVACVLRVHRSNFELHGFVGEPEPDEIAALCRERGVPLVFDLGSGVLQGAGLPGAEEEPSVSAALKAGCDVVTFSGDKLLGGPQAGLIVGPKSLVEKLRSDMLTRSLRLDKTLLAGLEATLSLHALGEEAALRRVPALRQLALRAEDLLPRAEVMAQQLQAAQVDAQVIETAGRVGSGAAPVRDLIGWGVFVKPHAGLDVDALTYALRMGRPGVFGRVQDGGVLLDLRTIEPERDAELQALVIAAANAT